MLNLIRMDLYRIFHSKSFYICLGALILCNILTFGILIVLMNPDLRSFLLHYGAQLSTDISKMEEALSLTTILDVFCQGAIQGGFFSVAIGVFAALLVCTDFDSGFIKNILSSHENKWDYILSKISCLVLVNFLYLAGTFLTTLLLNAVSGGIFSWSRTEDILFYLFSTWMVTNGFSALTLLICIVTRSKAAGAAAAICLNGGLIVMILNAVLNLFGLQKIMEFSLYINLASLKTAFQGTYPHRAWVTGVVFLVIYTVISKIVLYRRDI